MKHRYVFPILVFVFLATTSSANAQTSFSKSDIESLIGTTQTSHSYGGVGGQDAKIQALIDQVGPNQTWDFSVLEVADEGEGSADYIALPADLPGVNDPRVAAADYAVRIFAPGKRIADQSVGYFQLSDTEHLFHGTSALVQGAPVDLLYDQGLVEHPLPLNYNDTWNGMATWQVSNSGFTFDYMLETSGTADGWGMLVLPGTDPVPVLRLNVLRTQTQTILGIPTVTSFRVISFISKSANNATISITPPLNIGPDMLHARYSVEGSGGGGTQAPTDPPGSLTPADNATSVPVDPTLIWGPTTGADTYDVQVATDASFTKSGSSLLVVDVTGLANTTYNVTGLATGTTYFWRARGVNSGGAGPWAPTQSFTTVTGVAVEQLEGSLPTEFALRGNYPNPFNPQTTIQFDIAENSVVRLSVFDLLGREVDVLVSDQMSPGRYEFNWDAGDRPSGVYLYRLKANSFSASGRMLLLK